MARLLFNHPLWKSVDDRVGLEKKRRLIRSKAIAAPRREIGKDESKLPLLAPSKINKQQLVKNDIEGLPIYNPNKKRRFPKKHVLFVSEHVVSLLFLSFGRPAKPCGLPTP
jgi:hypothetical protein